MKGILFPGSQLKLLSCWEAEPGQKEGPFHRGIQGFPKNCRNFNLPERGRHWFELLRAFSSPSLLHTSALPRGASLEPQPRDSEQFDPRLAPQGRKWLLSVSGKQRLFRGKEFLGTPD